MGLQVGPEGLGRGNPFATFTVQVGQRQHWILDTATGKIRLASSPNYCAWHWKYRFWLGFCFSGLGQISYGTETGTYFRFRRTYEVNSKGLGNFKSCRIPGPTRSHRTRNGLAFILQKPEVSLQKSQPYQAVTSVSVWQELKPVWELLKISRRKLF